MRHDRLSQQEIGVTVKSESDIILAYGVSYGLRARPLADVSHLRPPTDRTDSDRENHDHAAVRDHAMIMMDLHC